MKYIVYQTINLINNKIYIGVHLTENPNVFDGYIGCGCRINIPSSYENPKSPLLYALKKYGHSNFRRSTLFIFDTLEEAYDKERDIVTYDFIKRSDTYNAQLGGTGGDYILNPVHQFDLNGKYLKTWNTLQQAANFYNVSHTAIFNAVKFKNSSVNYFWSYEKNININNYSYQEKHTCYKYDGETLKFVESYQSIKEAADVNHTYPQSIRRSILSGYKTDGHYYSDKIYDIYLPVAKVNFKHQNLYVYTLDGEFIVELHNINEIKLFFNIKSLNSIHKCIRANLPYKNYLFNLNKVDQMPKVTNNRNMRKKVKQYTETGDFVAEFDSITDAVKIYGTGVLKVLKGQQKHCKHFVFKLVS